MANAGDGSGSWSSGLLDCFDDPVVALLGYCFPCVLYGQFAEKVHGGQLVNHCLKFWLYSCICACGFVSGPTRRAIRETYSLPVEPGFLSEQGNNADCLTGTIPCVNCLALCQDAREVNSRGVSSPIKPVEFSWAPVSADNPAQAPAQAEMQK